jgi:hypothetical protein
LPEILKQYENIADRESDGKGRLFGYASLVKIHTNEKPESSKGIPNERARLPGMEVAMNVLAAGEQEFRGTRDTYTDEKGAQKKFANVGVYAGLEPATSPDGYAEGLTITTRPEDRKSSLMAYIKRELGNPPDGISLNDLFDPAAKVKFDALKNTPQDDFGMYKFQVVDVELDNGKKAPAITVATNEKSKFSAIGISPAQAAHLILDGQGYKRILGETRCGGDGLDYFKDNVIAVMKELGFNQPRLTQIDQEVEKLAGIYAKAHDTLDRIKPPPKEEQKIFNSLVEAGLKGVYSPFFRDGENVNERDTVPLQEKQMPDNRMPHTATEKFARIADLQKNNKTSHSR